MDYGHVLRRLVHMCTPLFLVYYWIPDPLWRTSLDKRVALILLLVVVLIFEAIRLRRKWHIVGMREYEYRRMSAAAWSAIALVFTFLFFPLELAAPALLGMGFIDPLIGELRRHKSKMYPLLPTLLYFVIVLAALAYLIGFDYRAVLAAIVATALAIELEKMRWRQVDDDFLMIVPPLLGMAAVYWITASLS
jgi:hypothetical protein